MLDAESTEARLAEIESALRLQMEVIRGLSTVPQRNPEEAVRESESHRLRKRVEALERRLQDGRVRDDRIRDDHMRDGCKEPNEREQDHILRYIPAPALTMSSIPAEKMEAILQAQADHERAINDLRDATGKMRADLCTLAAYVNENRRL
jgi:hypothetical protein